MPVVCPWECWSFELIGPSIFCVKSIFADCFSNPVGIAAPNIIFDRQMTASSIYNPSTKAAYGRLNDERGDGWCSLVAKSNAEWLQVDIGKTIQACGLATQGGVPSTRREWVKDFKLDYSFDGENWKNYRDENGEEMVRFIL